MNILIIQDQCTGDHAGEIGPDAHCDGSMSLNISIEVNGIIVWKGHRKCDEVVNVHEVKTTVI